MLRLDLRLWFLLLLPSRLRQYFLLLLVLLLVLPLPLALEQVWGHPDAETFAVATVDATLAKLRQVTVTQPRPAFLQALQPHSLTGATEESPAGVAAVTFAIKILENVDFIISNNLIIQVFISYLFHI